MASDVMKHFKQMGIGILILTTIMGGSVAIGLLLRTFPWIFVASFVLALGYMAGGFWLNRKL